MPDSLPQRTHIVYVMPDPGGRCWHWAKVGHSTFICGISSEAFLSEWEAYLAAAGIARCNGYKLVAPDEIKARLITYWRAVGREKWAAGHGVDLCANQFERQGWTAADAELEALFDEMLLKPGLGADDAPAQDFVLEHGDLVAA